jgi:hypothetical protein
MTPIKLTPNPSAAMRERFKRTRKWLHDESAIARELLQELHALEKSFSDCKSRCDELSESAATDETAALALATAEVQMRRLRPRIENLPEKLARQFESLARQIWSVRKDDIRANFANELTQQLYDQMRLEQLLKPYIDPGFSLTLSAKQFFGVSFQRSYLAGYLSQPAPDIDSIDAAESAVKQIVAELSALIDGKTLLEIGPAPEPARPKKVERKETPRFTREQVVEMAGQAAGQLTGSAS